MTTMVAASLPLKADETQCKSVLHKCDEAVKDLQSENNLQKQIIADEDERFKTQTKELNTEQIWKPLFLGGIVVIGAETLVLILKH